LVALARDGKRMGNDTTYLMATPSFLTGMASAMNLAGNFYRFNFSRTDAEADVRALRSDFNAVGNDLRVALLSEAIEQAKTTCRTK